MYFKIFFCRSDNFFDDTLFPLGRPLRGRCILLEQAFEVSLTTCCGMCQFVVKNGRDEIYEAPGLVEMDGVSRVGHRPQGGRG